MPGVEKHELGQLLMLTLQDFQQRLDQDLLSAGFPGVRYRHRALFMHLERHGASRSVDLAGAAGIRPQSMMKIVRELEDLGLIRRRLDPTDSRAKLIEFTLDGERLIDQLKQSTERVWKQYVELLDEKTLERMLSGMRQLLAGRSE